MSGTALVTGATGFIGRRLVARLAADGVPVRAAARHGGTSVPHVEFVTADLTDPASLRGVCRDVETVFHLAGYAHADDADDAAAAAIHDRVTVQGTAALLSEALHHGVRRLVFVSSVKAMGEGGDEKQDELSDAAPTSAYGRAKLDAERLILQTGRDRGMHVCVLRLPLVYGCGGRGNLTRMIAQIARSRFPPLPNVGNKRSMVHVDDVVDALLLVARDERASGQIYIVTDDQPYSTRQLYEWICRALDKPLPRWSFPLGAWRAIARGAEHVRNLTGMRLPIDSRVVEKLFGSAYYSSDRIRRELGFTSKRRLYEALPDMVSEYRRTGGDLPKR